LSFNCQARHADLLNGQLQNLIAEAKAGNGDMPYTDYNHEDGAASSRPVRIYWGGEDPKKGGIRLVTKWTATARNGVRDGEWSRFSPRWQFDPRTEEPTGLDTNLGGLVNQAAFKQIATVVARHAGAATKTNIDNMTKEEISQVFAEALKPLNDKVAALEAKAGAAADPKAATTAQAANAGDIGKIIETAMGTALKPITDKITQFETDAKNNRTAQAKAAVQVHVKRGAIAPQDTDSIKFWEEQHIADAAKAETQMGKLTARATSVRLTTSAAGDTTTDTPVEMNDSENRVFAQAKKIQGDKKDINTAQALEAFLRTPEGNQAYAEILSGRSSKRTDLVRA